jgi:hypothetical protein
VSESRDHSRCPSPLAKTLKQLKIALQANRILRTQPFGGNIDQLPTLDGMDSRREGEAQQGKGSSDL